MAADGADLVAIAFVDLAGVARVKVVPGERFGDAARDGVGASTTFAVFRGDDGMAREDPRSNPVGDMRLVPDADALAGPVDGWAWAPADQRDQEGEPQPWCARTCLRRQVARAADAGLELRMAYETEWYAEAADGGPLHDGPAYGLATLAEAGAYLQHVAARLAAHGVAPAQIHPEYSPGQLEVSVAAADPVAAADRVVLVRHLIRTARAATGVRASFAPLVGEGSLGNGCHLHVSVWRDGENLLGSGSPDLAGLGRDGEAFLAGVLAELPALVALGCSGPLSYRRIGPSRWTGAWTCWGVENREAPLRLIRGSHGARPGAANAEVKVADASANPYLFAAGVIAAGLAGLERGSGLPEETTVDPATLSADERARRGMAALPPDAAAAGAALARSDVLRAALGDDLAGAVAAVRAAEHREWTGRRTDDLLSFYRWRY